jgi:predicted O-linked N-acetylglucosamine transferase (SPINDLY family)
VEPAVNALPALASGRITFGCLNNYRKVNAEVLQLWARVLALVKDSRLIVLSPTGDHRDRALQLFAANGVTSDRIVWFDRAQRLRYLAAYHVIDIGLDTLFPYNGHTTSLDSFWMGVPVITLSGNTVAGRGGASQLMNLGLPELIAPDEDGFVEIAAALAGDLPRLAALRQGLRGRMERSPLMDAARFASNLESAYRGIWRRWCGARGRKS